MPYPSPITYPSALLHPGLAGSASPVSLGSLVLGVTDDDGTVWGLQDFKGWHGSAASTLQLTPRARAHGATGSEPFYGARVMTLAGIVRAQTADLSTKALDALNAAVDLDPFQMLVSESGRIRNAMVQRQGEVLPVKLNNRMFRYSIQVVAKDPLKYGDLTTATTLLPFSSGGRTYPATYPITYTGSSNTGIVRINNPGNTQAPVWLRIDGPVPAGGWTVTHIGKKQSLAFASSLALVSGEFVTADMERREILAQGQAARAGYVTSRGWFSLDPGDNDIAFSAANYSSTALLTVTTKPAWS